ncbi:MAG TPA: DUF1206 domain-containing protein [Opitutaceae bacterium]|nr:DUF1206 domain-containing protein [Opitutaceae bacterium]
MKNPTSAAGSAIPKATTQQKRSAAAWVTPVARIGFASIAVVYLTIGILALLFAAGEGGDAIDQRGAIDVLEGLPGGTVLLAIIALGMAGYALWRLLQGTMDLQEKGTDAKGIAIRIGYIASGVAYASLAVHTAKELVGSAGDGDSGKSLSAWLLANESGALILGAIGLAVIGWGVWHFIKAYKEKFMKHVKTAQMSHNEQTWMRRVGKFGLGARGVVLITLGILVIKAARHHDPNKVEGIDGALRELASQPYGIYILGVVALGLIAYGLYWGFNVRYRRISAS